MYSVAMHTGKLLEFRFVSPVTLEDSLGFRREALALIQRHPGKVVACADLTQGQTLAQDVAESILGTMRVLTPHFERACVMLPTTRPTYAMQMERLIREAKSPVRRAFFDVPDALTWLSEVLDAAEQARAREFLQRR